MQLILQSVLLRSLTFALLNSIWQSALIWLALQLVFMFRLTASQKATLAFVAQLTGFLVFIYTLVDFYLTKNSLVVFNSGSFYNVNLQYFSLIIPYLSIIYLFGLTWQFFKMIFIYRSTQDLRYKNLKKISLDNRIFVKQLTGLLSLKKRVSIYLSLNIKCPMTIGFLKPAILIPLAAINYLTKEQLEAVILHEMAHIKRYDYLLNFIQLVIKKIFFFNIFSKLIHDIIEHERENACDDFVLQFKYNSFHYAEALLTLGKLQTTNVFAMAASGKKENVLLLRVKRLIYGSSKRNAYSLLSLVNCFYCFNYRLYNDCYCI